MNTQTFLTIALSLIMGLSCAHFARGRGRNPRTWFILGILFGIFGLIALFLLPRPKTNKTTQAQPAVPSPLLTAISPSHVDKLWYFLDAEKTQFGPMSIDALSKEFREGKVNQETYVWNETMEKWERVQDIFKPA